MKRYGPSQLGSGGSVHQQGWESARTSKQFLQAMNLKVEPIFRKIEAKEIEQGKNKPKANHNDKTWTHAGALPALP